jgi:transcriptional regulator with XRE-family HTH domain
MATQPGPLFPRRRIATELRRLRDASGLSLTEVADATLISKSKLSRLENAQGSPQLRDVRDLIAFYKINDSPDANRLYRWVRSAQQQGWWQAYDYAAEGAAAGLGAHVEYEREASFIRVYTIPFVPALLQTKEYASALYRALEPWRSSSDVDQLVRLRQERQKIVQDEKNTTGVRLQAIMHECSLHQHVGDARVLKRQIEHLVKSCDNRSIEFQILPFSAQPPFASTTMWALLEFSDSLVDDVVHIETHAGFRFIESQDEVAQYRRHYGELQRRAIPSSGTRQFLVERLEQMRD